MYIQTTEGPAQEQLRHSLGDADASSREADRRFKQVAALITDGLKTAKDTIPQLSSAGKPTGKQELLRFMVSLLETYFFPRGHGLIDAQGKVLRLRTRTGFCRDQAATRLSRSPVDLQADDERCWRPGGRAPHTDRQLEVSEPYVYL